MNNDTTNKKIAILKSNVPAKVKLNAIKILDNARASEEALVGRFLEDRGLLGDKTTGKTTKTYQLAMKYVQQGMTAAQAVKKAMSETGEKANNKDNVKDNDTDKAIKLLEKLDTLLNGARRISSEILNESRFEAGATMNPFISRIVSSSKIIIDDMAKVKTGR